MTRELSYRRVLLAMVVTIWATKNVLTSIASRLLRRSRRQPQSRFSSAWSILRMVVPDGGRYGSANSEGRANAVELAARTAGFDVRTERLIFPDTVVIFIHARADQILLFVRRTPGAISEIRRATGTIEPFLERGTLGVGQHEFVTDLAARITPPVGEVPVVCVLDTGVSAAHPLIALGLTNAWAYDDAWLTDDHEPNGGHGTGLAGLVLYGDLEVAMNDQRKSR